MLLIRYFFLATVLEKVSKGVGRVGPASCQTGMSGASTCRHGLFDSLIGLVLVVHDPGRPVGALLCCGNPLVVPAIQRPTTGRVLKSNPEVRVPRALCPEP